MNVDDLNINHDGNEKSSKSKLESTSIAKTVAKFSRAVFQKSDKRTRLSHDADDEDERSHKSEGEENTTDSKHRSGKSENIRIFGRRLSWKKQDHEEAGEPETPSFLIESGNLNEEAPRTT